MCRYPAAPCSYELADQAESWIAPQLLDGSLAWLRTLGAIRNSPWLVVQTHDHTATTSRALTDGVPAPAPPPPPPADQALSAEAQPIYQWLLAWRAKRAQATGQPAEFLAPDYVLALIACQHRSLPTATHLGRIQSEPCGWA